ncbi:hypothetical protein RJD24_01825 [Bacillaceae bacterium IKA-2]|nr:hypothetical protein RJD24_01825 [Bacillaceae bacterium IKA-2]
MVDNDKLVVGAWIDAIGTIISAIAEVRTLAGLDGSNNKLVAIGEGLQAFGTMLIGTVLEEDPLNFVGNWIDGAGAAASSLGAYFQYTDIDNGVDSIRLAVIGDLFQSLGAAISAKADYLSKDIDNIFAIGNGLQSLGAGLEAIGGVYELKERADEGQPLTTIGAILQAAGSNLNALALTNDVREK